MQGIYTKEEGGHRKGIITIKVLGQFMYTSDMEGSILVRRGRTCVGMVCCLLPRQWHCVEERKQNAQTGMSPNSHYAGPIHTP